MSDNKQVAPTEEEGIKRMRDKAKEMKKRYIVPPIDEDEPEGLISGGHQYLFENEDDEEES